MNTRSLLIGGLSAITLFGCDVLLEEEGAGPPPPNMPAPPPLDDYEPLPEASSFPEVMETPVPDSTLPGPDPTPQSEETSTPDSAEAGDMQGNDNIFAMPLEEKLVELAKFNAAPCSTVLNDNSETIAEAANAQPPVRQPRVGAAVVGGGMSSASQSLMVMIGDYPGIAKLEPREQISENAESSGHCGATRIANNWFITAAHCLDDSYDRIILRVGGENLSSPLVRDVEANGAICHAGYTGTRGNLLNDIALIHISNSVAAELPNTPSAALVEADDALNPATVPSARMAGWGMTTPGGNLSMTLLGAEVTIGQIGPALIRINSVEGKGPCVGDSGGPLFVDGVSDEPLLIGVLSGVEYAPGEQACEGDYTARYTNVQGYLGWLNSVRSACESNAALCLVR